MMAYEEESTDKKPRVRSASNSKLPMISALDRDLMDTAKDLLREGVALKAQISAAEERVKEITEELSAIAGSNEMDGFRWGLMGFEYHGYTTRKSLSKEALVENGVTAEQIAKSFRESKPFLSAKIVQFDLE